MPVKSVIVLSLLSLVASTPFKKCCPEGEVFSAKPVDCVPAPTNATELYVINPGNENVTYDKFPICEKPEDIDTKPFSEIKPNDFLQHPFCTEILYVQDPEQNVPLLVHCKSDKNRDGRYLYNSTSASLPRFLNIRRCCKNQTIFNVRTGICESINASDEYYSGWRQEFLSILPKSVGDVAFLNVHSGIVNCSEALFTYELRVEDLTFEDGYLKVTLPAGKDKATENFILTEKNACLELTSDFQTKRRLVARVCRKKKLCLDYGCITKCTKKDVSNSQMSFFEEASDLVKAPVNATAYGFLYEKKCKNGMHRLNRSEITGITKEGYLIRYPFDYDQSLVPPLLHNMYCMDIRIVENSEIFLIGACFPDQPIIEFTLTTQIVYNVLESISCIFLLLTLLVYACLPVLRNLHGKTLMCHAASLFSMYICLIVIPWVTPDNKSSSTDRSTRSGSCMAMGFLLQFFNISTFSWLNVMCFDIWRTFGRLRGNISRGRRRTKKFLCYCLYAWGLSFTIVCITVIVDHLESVPSLLQPSFGVMKCSFGQYLSELTFSRGPVAIQLTLNAIFFILTAKQCSKVKAEISRVADPLDPRSKRFHADKIKFIMNVKLFIVMGITWTMELTSSLVEAYSDFEYKTELFYIFDAINCLQGVIIFFLFVVKHRVHQALKQRFGFDTQMKTGGSSAGASMLQDPLKIKKSVSNSTLTSSFAVSTEP